MNIKRNNYLLVNQFSLGSWISRQTLIPFILFICLLATPVQPVSAHIIPGFNPGLINNPFIRGMNNIAVGLMGACSNIIASAAYYYLSEAYNYGPYAGENAWGIEPNCYRCGGGG